MDYDLYVGIQGMVDPAKWSASGGRGEAVILMRSWFAHIIPDISFLGANSEPANQPAMLQPSLV